MSNKPTLLITTSTYPRWSGDPEPGFVHELARRLTSRFEVVVLCPHAPGALRRERLDEVDVVRFRYAPAQCETLVNGGGIAENLKKARWKWLLVPLFCAAQLSVLVWLTWRRKPAVIQAHWIIPQGLIAVIAGLLTRSTKLLVTSHGADLYAFRGRPMKLLKRWVLRRASALTVVSQAMVEQLDELEVEHQHVSVLPMGAELGARFVPNPLGTRELNEILFVGRLVEKKGLLELIEALPSIQREWSDVRLTIVGSGPLEQQARALIERLTLSACIRFIGAVSQENLPGYYQRATMLVAPFVRAESGDQEGLGLVVAEALGCECPVVVGDVPSMRDFDLRGVDARDSQQLAEAVLTVHRMSIEKRTAIVRDQRSRCLALFDWSTAALHYERLLLDLAEMR